jgi:hypothetical protein
MSLGGLHRHFDFLLEVADVKARTRLHRRILGKAGDVGGCGFAGSLG